MHVSEKRIAAAAGVVLLVLVVNAAVSYRATRALIADYGWLNRTHETLTLIEGVASTMADAEAGQRGYILSGDERFLEPYTRALSRIDRQLDALERLVADVPEQEARMAALRSSVGARLSELAETVEMQRTGREGEARQAVLTGRGRRRMETLRRVIDAMEEEEDRKLMARAAQSEVTGRRALVAFAVSNVALLALVLVAFYLVHRYLQERRRAERVLRDARDRLGVLVEERTADLARANEGLRAEVAERRRAEARLVAFTRELERSNRELQDFAYVASHDLQEPLRKIQAFGDRLQRRHADALDEDGRDSIRRMQRAAARMHVLINDLLMYSRLTRHTRPFAEVDLGAVVREVVEDLETRIQETGGTVEAEGLPTIEADATQMRQLLQNLIGNALKFHRPGVPPHVRVTAEPAAGGERIELRVEDNGIGFEEKYLGRIFTPFQRLHDRNTYEGTGIGLAVCRRIVERHGGAITARSSPGEGTTFLVTLPVRQPEPDPSPNDAAPV